MKLLNIENGLNSLGEFKLSQAQQNYLIHGTYELQSINGQKLTRILQIVGVNHSTGDLLILEKCSDGYLFNKMFILSCDGETKKYKGQDFLQVS